MCDAHALSNETRLDPSEGRLRLEFGITGAKDGIITSAPVAAFFVDRARVCMSCGYVFMAIDTASLKSLSEKQKGFFAIPQD